MVVLADVNESGVPERNLMYNQKNLQIPVAFAEMLLLKTSNIKPPFQYLSLCSMYIVSELSISKSVSHDAPMTMDCPKTPGVHFATKALAVLELEMHLMF